MSNLPDGLTYNEKLRAIVGRATTVGVYSVQLTATNAQGSVTDTLNLMIRAAPANEPEITSSNSATARVGRPFRFQVFTTGAGPAATLTATDLPPGLALNADIGRITGTPTTEGDYAVSLTVTKSGGASTTETLQITVTADVARPVIESADEALITIGQPFSYAIVAPAETDPNDPTTFDLIGTLPQGLGFDPATGVISGTPTGGVFARRGDHARSRNGPGPPPDVDPLSGGIITNVQLFATNSIGTGTLPLVFFVAPSGVVNIATRMAIGLDENILIGGFILSGNAPKKLILRAIAPSLRSGDEPLAAALQDPTMQLRDGAGDLIVSNDDWRSAQEQEIVDSSVPPPDDRESAIVATLNPGAYTTLIGGKDNTTGIGLVEVYDLGTASLESTSNAKLANISTRGFVQTGDDIMIGGFIVNAASSRVIVRAIGPSLAAAGVAGALPDTTLDLVDGNGSLIVSNDDWRTGGQEQQIIDSTVQPADDRESAVVATLDPGAYTAVVRGANGRTGVGLVEVYVLP